MNKQEQAVNAQQKLLKIHNIRINHLATLEADLLADQNNSELNTKVIQYRAFVAKEQSNIDRIFAKMGWA